MSDTSALEAFHSARSRFIDAFSEVETRVCKRLISVDLIPHGQLGNKIESLKAIKASSKYSNTERTRVHAALDALLTLNEIRCDVVHAPMKLVKLDGESIACFVNPHKLAERTLPARLVTAEAFEAAIKELTKLASDLA